MKKRYDINVKGTRSTPTTPPLYRAIDDEGQALGTYTSIDEAKRRLLDLLEEYHESIAFEADHHHVALDERFFADAYVEAF